VETVSSSHRATPLDIFISIIQPAKAVEF